MGFSFFTPEPVTNLCLSVGELFTISTVLYAGYERRIAVLYAVSVVPGTWVWWPTAEKQAAKWYRGVIEPIKRLMVRWNEDGTEKPRERHIHSLLRRAMEESIACNDTVMAPPQAVMLITYRHGHGDAIVIMVF